MKGLADGAEVDYNFVLKVHMLPELVKVRHDSYNYNEI